MKNPFSTGAVLALAVAVAACSPKYDWRDYRGAEAPYIVLFPGKPATHTRTVSLAGAPASMTMAATEIDGTMFAVGCAELPDAGQAQHAAQAMKAAMVRNIGGSVEKETARDGGVELEAHGINNGRPMRLHGRFLARGKRAYQVVVLGPDQGVDAENVDTFLRSFKVN